MKLEQMINKRVIGTEEVTAINSREVYNYLGLGKGQYSRWIKTNLLDIFTENTDYVGVRHEVEGNKIVDYIVTIEVVKHLCMMARTDKGKETRDYFIQIEKEANKPMSKVEIALMTLEKTLANEKKQLELETKTNKVIEDVQEVKAAIIYAKTKEVPPTEGFGSISTLENLFASKFPKSHIKGLLVDEQTKRLIKEGPTATKWVDGSATWTNYPTYNILDMGELIKMLIKTGVRVIGTNGKPTQKLKSPLYGQEFKYKEGV